MITLTARTIEGDSGWSVDQLDAATVALSVALSGPSEPWQAAEFLRDVYSDVIRTAGAVTLTLPATVAATVAA